MAPCSSDSCEDGDASECACSAQPILSREVPDGCSGEGSCRESNEAARQGGCSSGDSPPPSKSEARIESDSSPSLKPPAGRRLSTLASMSGRTGQYRVDFSTARMPRADGLVALGYVIISTTRKVEEKEASWSPLHRLACLPSRVSQPDLSHAEALQCKRPGVTDQDTRVLSTCNQSVGAAVSRACDGAYPSAVKISGGLAQRRKWLV